MMIPAEEFIDCLRSGEIPPSWPEGTSAGGWGLDMKDLTAWRELGYFPKSEAQRLGMYGLVTVPFAVALSSWIGARVALSSWIGARVALEIMSGVGWLAKALDEQGTTIIATDSYKWHRGRMNDESGRWQWKLVHPVRCFRGETAVRHFPEAEILIVSWPWMDEDICVACEAWGPDRPILYIGEAEGGCTACDEFFRHFEDDPDHAGFHHKTWSGIHDEPRVGYYRKNGS
jgi:hypothetical protein